MHGLAAVGALNTVGNDRARRLAEEAIRAILLGWRTAIAAARWRAVDPVFGLRGMREIRKETSQRAHEGSGDRAAGARPRPAGERRWPSRSRAGRGRCRPR